MVSIRGSDGEVAAHALRFAHCSAGSHHSMAVVAVPGLNAVAFNPVAVVSASNVVSARLSKNLTLLVETAMCVDRPFEIPCLAMLTPRRSSVGALVASFAGYEYPGTPVKSCIALVYSCHMRIAVVNNVFLE
jgi:hypothetical protein